jgi:hypothetical protein
MLVAATNENELRSGRRMYYRSRRLPPYVDEVIMRDPVIVTHNDTAAKKIRSSYVKKRLPRPDDAELHEFFRAHWSEWVRLSMKTVRARPNPAPTIVASQ